MTHVIGIAGSLRRDSHNAALLRAARDAAPAGVSVEIWDGLRTVPPYDEDDDLAGPGRVVKDLRARIAEADAVLFSTPEYNASVPGVLKNAVDWLSRPFPGNALWGKPAGVMGASTGQFGAVWAQEELRKVLRTAGARVLADGVVVAKAHLELAGGQAGPELSAQLADLLGALRSEAVPVTV